MEQVEQALIHCTHERTKTSLYAQWKNRNKKSPAPPGPSPAIARSYIRPPAELDDCDRAIIANCSGDPLPDGWACITGAQLMAAIDASKGFSKTA